MIKQQFRSDVLIIRKNPENFFSGPLIYQFISNYFLSFFDFELFITIPMMIITIAAPTNTYLRMSYNINTS